MQANLLMCASIEKALHVYAYTVPYQFDIILQWFEYGAKAYNRMPCGAGPAPLKISDILTNWCPVKECCLNYAALSKDEKSEFMSYYIFMQNFGGSGTFSHFAMSPVQAGLPNMQNPFAGMHGPGQQTPYDPRIFYYLLSASSTSDLSDLFCPYKKAFGSSFFPDLSEYADGCCDIPKCYHKKEVRCRGRSKSDLNLSEFLMQTS